MVDSIYIRLYSVFCKNKFNKNSGMISIRNNIVFLRVADFVLTIINNIYTRLLSRRK